MSPHPQLDATFANLGDDSANIWQRAERLCRAVAKRDLEGVPLYVLPQSSMPLDLSTEHHYAFTTPRADLLFRDHIDPWRGRGPCIIVNDIGLAEDINSFDLPYVTLNCVLHELAHILDWPTLYAQDTGVTPAKIQFDQLAMIDCLRRPTRTDIPPYFGHERSFALPFTSPIAPHVPDSKQALPGSSTAIATDSHPQPSMPKHSPMSPSGVLEWSFARSRLFLLVPRSRNSGNQT